MKYELERLGREHEAMSAWDHYVLESPTASGYHLTVWRDIIEKIFGHKTMYFMVRDKEGQVQGILPLVLLNSRLFGRFMTSMPFLTYGGIDAAVDAVRHLLAAAASNEGRILRVRHIELRQAAQLPGGWKLEDSKVAMQLALPREFQTLMGGFPSKLRSQIRRPQKEGMVGTIGGGELLDEFYSVFARNMRDLGTPVYGKTFFKHIVETLPKETAICTVSLNRKTLAAAFLYTFRDTMEIPWASSDHRYDRMAPNMLLYTTVLEYACRQGCKIFDFGRSTIGSGTYRFKEQWGARPLPLYRYYWLHDGDELPGLNPQSRKYSLAIKIWKKLPLGFTTLAGPHIRKYLP